MQKLALKVLIASAIIGALVVIIIGCSDGGNGNGNGNGNGDSFAYVCQNGTEIDGTITTQDTVGCNTCNPGYHRENADNQPVSSGGAGISCVLNAPGAFAAVGDTSNNFLSFVEEDPRGIAFGRTTAGDVVMYMVGDQNDTLYAVDYDGAGPGYGVATPIGHFGNVENAPRGLVFRFGDFASVVSSDGMYIAGDQNDAVYMMNRDTGAATRMGTGFQLSNNLNVVGLARLSRDGGSDTEETFNNLWLVAEGDNRAEWWEIMILGSLGGNGNINNQGSATFRGVIASNFRPTGYGNVNRFVDGSAEDLGTTLSDRGIVAFGGPGSFGRWVAGVDADGNNVIYSHGPTVTIQQDAVLLETISADYSFTDATSNHPPNARIDNDTLNYAVANRRLYEIGTISPSAATIGRPGGTTEDRGKFTVPGAEGFGQISEDAPAGLAAIGNTLYMVGGQNNALYRLDPADGRLSRVNGTSTATDFGAVAATIPQGLAVTGGTLYMAAGKAGEDSRLYTIDTNTGVATSVGGPPTLLGGTGNTPGGIAFIGDTLYAVGGTNRALYNLASPYTGAATRVNGDAAAVNYGITGVEIQAGGLGAFDSDGDGTDDMLYMVASTADDSANALYIVNPTDGMATQVGTVSNFNVSVTQPQGLAVIDNALYMVGHNGDKSTIGLFSALAEQ